jgi:transposase-like protein
MRNGPSEFYCGPVRIPSVSVDYAVSTTKNILRGIVPVQLKVGFWAKEKGSLAEGTTRSRTMKQERRSWSAEEKTRVLRRHLIEKIPISKVCDEEKVSPSMYHRWQEQLFQNAALALEGKRTERHPEQQKIEKLEQKIRQKDEVLAELMAEHISLKKEFGEL